jgi:hypothetical protein
VEAIIKLFEIEIGHGAKTKTGPGISSRSNATQSRSKAKQSREIKICQCMYTNQASEGGWVFSDDKSPMARYMYLSYMRFITNHLSAPLFGSFGGK